MLIGLFENLSWLLYKSSGISPSLLNGIPLFATVYPEPGSSIQKLKEIISLNYMIRFEMDASLVELHSENVSCWHFNCKALNKGHIFVSLLTSLQKKKSKQNRFCCRTSKSVVSHQQTDNKTLLKFSETQSYSMSQAAFKLSMKFRLS